VLQRLWRALGKASGGPLAKPLEGPWQSPWRALGKASGGPLAKPLEGPWQSLWRALGKASAYTIAAALGTASCLGLPSAWLPAVGGFRPTAGSQALGSPRQLAVPRTAACRALPPRHNCGDRKIARVGRSCGGAAPQKPHVEPLSKGRGAIGDVPSSAL